MELKFNNGIDILKRYHSFNRTFMELKCSSGWTETRESNGFNRTFMELKWLHPRDEEHTHEVLIVPLWNWNTANIINKLKTKPF